MQFTHDLERRFVGYQEQQLLLRRPGLTIKLPMTWNQ